VKYTYILDSYFDQDCEYHAGDAVLVYSRYNVNTGEETFHFRKDFAESGYPGNMNSDIKCFHGWRGTTGNIATYAYGVYTIKSVEPKAGKWSPNEFTKVVLNKKDIKKDED